VATIAADPAQRGVAVGRVFGRGFGAIGHNPVPMVVLTILFAALPTAITDYLLSLAAWDSLVLTIGTLPLPGKIGEALAAWFVGLVIATLSQAALTMPVIAESEGRTAGLGECLAAAIRALVPLLILGAITGVAVLIGFTLLIVPAILVYVLWSVAPSVLVDEREGVFMALGRSQELGEGARWKILGIVLVLDAMVLVAGILVSFFSWALLGPQAMENRLSPVMILLDAVVNTAWFLISGSLLASLYVELKQWKEGDSVESLEQVFA
jgi:hypothetical protein